LSFEIIKHRRFYLEVLSRDAFGDNIFNISLILPQAIEGFGEDFWIRINFKTFDLRLLEFPGFLLSIYGNRLNCVLNPLFPSQIDSKVILCIRDC